MSVYNFIDLVLIHFSYCCYLPNRQIGFFPELPYNLVGNGRILEKFFTQSAPSPRPQRLACALVICSFMNIIVSIADRRISQELGLFC